MATRIKKGDKGIKVTISHNATAGSTVYYQIDGGGETALTDNLYLVLNTAQTTIRGDHRVAFIEESGILRVTSEDVFEYEVY